MTRALIGAALAAALFSSGCAIRLTGPHIIPGIDLSAAVDTVPEYQMPPRPLPWCSPRHPYVVQCVNRY